MINPSATPGVPAPAPLAPEAKPTPPARDDHAIATKPAPDAKPAHERIATSQPSTSGLPAPAPVAPPVPPAAATYRVLPNVSGGVQNLRSGPAIKYPVVVAIPAGATGIALGACRAATDNTRPWCAATWRGFSGFISSCCVVNEQTGALPKID